MTKYLGVKRDRHVAVGEYKVTPDTLSDGDRGEMQMDAQGNTKVADYGRADAVNDAITSYEKASDSKVGITASAQLLAGPGQLFGFWIVSHTAGATIRFSDALTATTPYVSSALTTTASHIAGQYIQLSQNGINMVTGCYVTITGTIELVPDVRTNPS